MKECVIIDGVRSPNCRAHAEKGWFRNIKPDVILTKVYEALFERNPKVNPEDIEAVFCGTSNQSGATNNISRFAWLAGGFPETVATNGISSNCPSGMSAAEHAARAIMCNEGDIYIVSGVEDMLHVPMGNAMEIPERLFKRYDSSEVPMGPTAEKVASQYNIERKEMETMALWSHKKAAEATKTNKFRNEIVPMDGEEVDGTRFIVDRDQWIREDISMEKMAGMNPAFKVDGIVTAATSSPLTTGACALLFMNRDKADELGLDYHLKYSGGAMAGNDPTVMGIGPIYAVRKLLKRTGLTVKDINVWEVNEAFASQTLAVLRELGIAENAPFENVNIWGGALALGHPLGESGARVIVTLNNIMKTDRKDAKYGIATLCGGFGNANATLWQNVHK
ncbi:MAG: thiolase family protein [Spirochaetota bacterium]|nr:thiolase family protein [Spirochaetota bacterium]